MSDLVGKPEDRFSHNEAQLLLAVLGGTTVMVLSVTCTDVKYFSSTKVALTVFRESAVNAVRTCSLFAVYL